MASLSKAGSHPTRRAPRRSARVMATQFAPAFESTTRTGSEWQRIAARSVHPSNGQLEADVLCAIASALGQ
jgi:hypothetical protein